MSIKFLIPLFIPNVLFGITNSFAQSPKWQWADAFEGSGNGQTLTINSAVDPIGNIYTVGSYFGTLDFDPGTAVFNMTSTGNMDYFITKLDPGGNFIWAKTIGGAMTTEQLSELVVDNSSNLYISGTFTGTIDFDPDIGVTNLSSPGNYDLFILKLDSAGAFVWVKTVQCITAIEVIVYAMVQDKLTGEIYLSGCFDGLADFDPGPSSFNLGSSAIYDVYVLKLDSSGNFIWATVFGGPGFDCATSLSVASSNLFIGGYYYDNCDFQPGPGAYVLSSFGNYDAFVSKFSTSGSFQWAVHMGGMEKDLGQSISTTANGDLYCSGDFNGIADFDTGPGTYNLTATPGAEDIFISKLDSLGNFIWAKRIGGYYPDVAHTMTADYLSGNVYLTGSYKDSVDFDPNVGVFNLNATGDFDAYVCNLDSSGNFVWAKSFGGIDYDAGNSIAISPSGGQVISGVFWSPSIDFDTINFSNPGVLSSDIFIAKLDSTIISGVSENPLSEIDQISSYPNPANEIVNIKIKSEDDYSVQILDIYGREVFAVKFNLGVYSIDVSDFAAGIYIIKVFSSKKSYCRKIIVSHN